ncbi:DJ-1/PfpI family protein [Luteolibacter sp. LG18]|uniref:DJ-1/PfpI family protein n=1 Tax=Luteolibacter sp. LG18 TaxID=2819286 RepID=UPI002B2F8562|nr:protease [Luteolibacter sp. LG18]
MALSLAGKRVAVLVETEFIPIEIDYYLKQFPALGAQVDLLSYLWGKPSRTLVADIDNPDKIHDVRTLVVDKDVADASADDYDIVIMAANYCAVRLREILPMGSLGSPEEIATPPAVRFYASAMENKRILKGAMCHGLWILTPRPDLLKGRQVICHTVVFADILNAGATFVPAPSHVVVDDDLVTARSAADLDAYFQAIVAEADKRGA